MINKLKKINLSTGTQQTAIYSVGLFLTKIISLIMIPIVTYFLSVENFGDLEVLVALINILSILFAAGLADSLFRFAGLAKDKEKYQLICANAMGLAILISVVIGIILIFMIKPLQHFLPGNISQVQIGWVIAALVWGGIQHIQLGWLRLQQRAGMYIIFSYGQALVQALISILLMALGYGVTGVIAAGAIAGGVATISLLIVQIKSTGIRLQKKYCLQLLKYGLPLIISGLVSFAFYGLDRWWLAKYIGVGLMAEYALAMKLGRVTGYLVQPFNTWYQARRFTLLKSEDGIGANSRLTTMAISFYLLSALVVAVGGIFIISVLTPLSYHNAIYYMPYVSFLVAFKGIGEVVGLGCYLHKTGSLIMFINIVGAIVAVLGFTLLIPHLGNMGAVIAMALAYLIRLVLFMYFGQKRLKLNYNWRRISLFVLVICLALYIGLLPDNPWFQVMLTGVLTLVAGLLGMYIKVLPKITDLIKIKNS